MDSPSASLFPPLMYIPCCYSTSSLHHHHSCPLLCLIPMDPASTLHASTTTTTTTTTTAATITTTTTTTTTTVVPLLTEKPSLLPPCRGSNSRYSCEAPTVLPTTICPLSYLFLLLPWLLLQSLHSATHFPQLLPPCSYYLSHISIVFHHLYFQLHIIIRRSRVIGREAHLHSNTSHKALMSHVRDSFNWLSDYLRFAQTNCQVPF